MDTAQMKNNVVAPAPPPPPPSPPSPEKRGKVLDVAEVKIPTDLVDIRAYVRWEDAGKPEDTPPEWQRAESAMARLDLQIEVLSGASLNDIRRKYNQTPVPGDDALAFDGWDVSEALRQAKKMRDDRVVRPPPVSAPDVPAAPEGVGSSPNPRLSESTWRRVAAIREGSSPSCGDDGEAIAPSKPSTFLDRWASEAPSPNGPSRLINKRMYPVGKDAQLLVRMYESEAADETSAGGGESASKRRVVFTTDAEDDLVLHWGVARDEPGQWLLPKETVWPADTEKVSEISVETPFIAGLGCLPAAEAAAAGGTVAEEEEECHPLQVLTLELPGEGAEELTGVQFVLRNAEGTVWYKDETNGNSNFRANYVAPGTDTSDELLDTIIRAEAGGGWWTLMHRFNLASSLLEQKCSPQAAESVASAAAAAAKIYVWLRYSSQRKLTWQRNYNVKPRELSAAQSKLTRVIAKLYCESPHLRDVTRLMLGTVGKGGEGARGSRFATRFSTSCIATASRRRKASGWRSGTRSCITTPPRTTSSSAKRTSPSSRLTWTCPSTGASSARGASPASDSSRSERPILNEPLPRPQIKISLIKDFTKYLAILKSVHSGADLIECIRACAGGLGGVSPALNYVRVAQRGDGDAMQLLSACVEARHQLRRTPARRGRGRRVDSRAAVPRSRHRRRRSPRCGALGRG